MASYARPADLGNQAVFAVTCMAFVLLGGLACYTGAASLLRGTLHVLYWDLLAMLYTHMIGSWFGKMV